MTITRSVQSSELSRNSREVFKAADEGPVIVTRRDGEDLVLESRQNVETERAGVELASHLVAASLAPSDAPFAERLMSVFPWMEFLSASGREEFAEEVVRVARACAAVSRYERLLITLNSWQDSAVAISMGYADRQVEWLDEGETVPDPRA